MSLQVEDPRIVEFDVQTDEMLVNMGPQHPSTTVYFVCCFEQTAKSSMNARRTSATCIAVQRRLARTCRRRRLSTVRTEWTTSQR